MFKIKISIEELENKKVDVRAKWASKQATEQESITGKCVLSLLDLLLRNASERTLINTDNIEDLEEEMRKIDERLKNDG